VCLHSQDIILYYCELATTNVFIFPPHFSTDACYVIFRYIRFLTVALKKFTDSVPTGGTYRYTPIIYTYNNNNNNPVNDLTILCYRSLPPASTIIFLTDALSSAVRERSNHLLILHVKPNALEMYDTISMTTGA